VIDGVFVRDGDGVATLACSVLGEKDRFWIVITSPAPTLGAAELLEVAELLPAELRVAVVLVEPLQAATPKATTTATTPQRRLQPPATSPSPFSGLSVKLRRAAASRIAGGGCRRSRAELAIPTPVMRRRTVWPASVNAG
jgi:hypothetical protein